MRLCLFGEKVMADDDRIKPRQRAAEIIGYSALRGLEHAGLMVMYKADYWEEQAEAAPDGEKESYPQMILKCLNLERATS